MRSMQNSVWACKKPWSMRQSMVIHSIQRSQCLCAMHACQTGTSGLLPIRVLGLSLRLHLAILRLLKSTFPLMAVNVGGVFLFCLRCLTRFTGTSTAQNSVCLSPLNKSLLSRAPQEILQQLPCIMKSMGNTPLHF